MPCGAALANASSAQCVLNQLGADTPPEPAVPLYAADQYVRLPCKARRWWDVQEAQEVLSFEVDGLEYFADGTDFAPAGLRPLNWENGEREQDALCLAVFVPDEQVTEIVALGQWPAAQFNDGATPLAASCWASFTH